MAGAAVIIGDWGNSNARLWLCAADGTVLDARRGAGIAAYRSDPAAIAAAFAALTADWPDSVPALLAGVVGASFGWRDAGYLSCPIAVDAIGSHAVRAPTNERPVWIAPGIRCINGWGEPDTMRGEELQIAGWAAADEGDALVALPGTHCKWARIIGGQVTSFHSAISGELYALLVDHSVMVDRTARNAGHDPAAFGQGAALAKTAETVDLAALLFGARARQATGAMSPEQAPSFLSGIIIGCDVRNAVRQNPDMDRVIVIGDAELAARYAEVLKLWDKPATLTDDEAAMRAGMMTAAKAAGIIG